MVWMQNLILASKIGKTYDIPVKEGPRKADPKGEKGMSQEGQTPWGQ